MLDINALISMVYILSRLAHYVDEINLGLIRSYLMIANINVHYRN